METAIKVIFTVAGNPLSEAVVEKLRELSLAKSGPRSPVCTTYSNLADLTGALAAVSPDSVLALWDATFKSGCRRHFRHYDVGTKKPCSLPEWAAKVRWAVVLNAGCFAEAALMKEGRKTAVDTMVRRCAEQIRANFLVKFADRVNAKVLPWGEPKSSRKKRGSYLAPRGSWSTYPRAIHASSLW